MLSLALLLLVTGSPPGTATDRCGGRYPAAAAALKAADKQMRKRRFDAANAILVAAIDGLGHVAPDGPSSDDGEMYLLHADSLARRGLIEAAATSRRSIFANRLQRCNHG